MSIFIGDASNIAHQIGEILKSQKTSTDPLTWVPTSFIALCSVGITFWYTKLTRDLLLQAREQSKQIKDQYNLDRIPNLFADVDKLNETFIRITNLGMYLIQVLEIKESHTTLNRMFLSVEPKDARSNNSTYMSVVQPGSSAYLVSLSGRYSIHKQNSDNLTITALMKSGNVDYDTEIKFVSGGTGKRLFTLTVSCKDTSSAFKSIGITSMTQEEIKL